jgi:hypothetical protein
MASNIGVDPQGDRPHGASGPVGADSRTTGRILPLHPQHGDDVRGALTMALQALQERSQTFRLLLKEPQIYGLADPDQLGKQVASDEAATAVLEALLA